MAIYTLSGDTGNLLCSFYSAKLIKNPVDTGTTWDSQLTSWDSGATEWDQGIKLLIIPTHDIVFKGQEASFSISYSFSSAVGSYTLVGEEAQYTKGKNLVVESGSFTLSGEPYEAARGYSFAVDSGSFLLEGQESVGKIPTNYSMSASRGRFLLRGRDAKLGYINILVASTTPFSLDGAAARLHKDLKLRVDPSSFSLQGQDNNAVINDGVLFYPGTGTINLNGNKTQQHITKQGKVGSFGLTGSKVDQIDGISFKAESANYIATGYEIDSTRSTLLKTEGSGSFVLMGNPIGLDPTVRLTAEVGSFNLSEGYTTLGKYYELQPEEGSYTLSGVDLSVDLNTSVPAEVGSFNVTTTDTTKFRRNLKGITAEAGEFLVSASCNTTKSLYIRGAGEFKASLQPAVLVNSQTNTKLSAQSNHFRVQLNRVSHADYSFLDNVGHYVVDGYPKGNERVDVDHRMVACGSTFDLSGSSLEVGIHLSVSLLPGAFFYTGGGTGAKSYNLTAESTTFTAELLDVSSGSDYKVEDETVWDNGATSWDNGATRWEYQVHYFSHPEVSIYTVEGQDASSTPRLPTAKTLVADSADFVLEVKGTVLTAVIPPKVYVSTPDLASYLVSGAPTDTKATASVRGKSRPHSTGVFNLSFTDVGGYTTKAPSWYVPTAKPDLPVTPEPNAWAREGSFEVKFTHVGGEVCRPGKGCSGIKPIPDNYRMICESSGYSIVLTKVSYYSYAMDRTIKLKLFSGHIGGEIVRKDGTIEGIKPIDSRTTVGRFYINGKADNPTTIYNRWIDAEYWNDFDSWKEVTNVPGGLSSVIDIGGIYEPKPVDTTPANNVIIFPSRAGSFNSSLNDTDGLLDVALKSNCK